MRISQEGRVLEKMLQYSLDMICTIDKGGCFVQVSDACKAIIGYESEELIGCPYLQFVHPDDLSITLQIGQDVSKGHKMYYFENRYIHKEGKEVPILWSSVWSEEEELFFCVARDATEQKLAREKLREKEELYKALMENGSDMQALVDEEGKYIYVGGSTMKILGYEPHQLMGESAFSFIHPQDIAKAQGFLLSIINSNKHIKIPALRFKDAAGEWRWIESIMSNQLQNPGIKALAVSSRDITDHILNKNKLQERKQRFKALFEANPDMIIFEDIEGNILDANPAVLSKFGIKLEEMVHRPLCQFLPLEKASFCTQRMNDILSGKQVNFEMELHFENIGTRILDITKIPVTVNLEIVGLYTIAKDVTAICTSHQIIRQQAKKLNTIFESITDAFFTLDNSWNVTYYNSEFNRLLLQNAHDPVGENLWEIFPEEVNGDFYKQCKRAFETGVAVQFETYLARVKKWLQVKAYPSEEGLSVYFDDITEKIKTKLELERLSLVASKITNGVMIVDAQGITEWVNEGFTNITGYSFQEAIGKRPRNILQGEETDQNALSRISENMKKGKPFKEEVLNYKKSGEKVWLSLDITPVLNDEGEVSRFITIQTDITFRKEAEASQLELTRDLYRQNKDLQQFTYIVSHNLRSPVANAMGLAEVLSTVDKDSDLFDDSLDFLRTSINNIDTVLRDLNMILSIRDKENTFEEEKITLAHKCKEVIESLQEPLQKCGGDVMVNIDPSIQVRGNRAYLYSIFHNLLSNAIKYRSPNRALKININCFGSADRGTVISFADNGSGFDMEKAGDNVFRLYKRFHSHSEGRGIGLFLVKTHIEAMGGYIEVSSELNKGTRFLIYLK